MAEFSVNVQMSSRETGLDSRVSPKAIDILKPPLSIGPFCFSTTLLFLRASRTQSDLLFVSITFTLGGNLLVMEEGIQLRSS